MNLLDLEKKIKIFEEKSKNNSKKKFIFNSFFFNSIYLFTINIISACFIGYIFYFKIYLKFFNKNLIIFALLLIVLMLSAIYSFILEVKKMILCQ
jgi:hypothetical protein